MADVKPDTLKPDIADGIYVKFQHNPHIFCIEQQRGTNVSPGRCQGESVKNQRCWPGTGSRYEIL